MHVSTPAERRTQAMAMPALPEADGREVDAFLDAVWAENGQDSIDLQIKAWR